MATVQQTLPASLRSSVRVAQQNRGGIVPDPRPYLVTPQHRKPVKAAQHYLALFPHESEDARLTGATRSLYRRLLALNLPGVTTRVEAGSAVMPEVMKPVILDPKVDSKIA